MWRLTVPTSIVSAVAIAWLEWPAATNRSTSLVLLSGTIHFLLLLRVLRRITIEQEVVMSRAPN
jgi:hypothetical protein